MMDRMLRREREQGLGQLENMWQFLDGESPETEMTNYRWMVSRMSEAADDLDAGLDELDRFTGVEEEAWKLRPNPYLREIKNRQEELRQALHGGGNKDGLLYHSDPRNDYDKEYAEENRDASFRDFRRQNQELAKEESGKQPVEKNKGPKLPQT